MLMSTIYFMKPNHNYVIKMRKAIHVKIFQQNKRFLFYIIIYCNFVSVRRGKKEVNRVSW